MPENIRKIEQKLHFVDLQTIESYAPPLSERLAQSPRFADKAWTASLQNLWSFSASSWMFR